MRSIRQALRQATEPHHRKVDDAFGRFNLSHPDDYGDFLDAHARALPALEAALEGAGAAAHVRPRAALLAHDLNALRRPAPQAPSVGDLSDAAAWGVAYVLEGSRLGGALLAGRVGEGLPTDYLSARHQPGEWRSFQEALEAAGEGQDEAWLDEARRGAQAAFALFEAAAG